MELTKVKIALWVGWIALTFVVGRLLFRREVNRDGGKSLRRWDQKLFDAAGLAGVVGMIVLSLFILYRSEMFSQYPHAEWLLAGIVALVIFPICLFYLVSDVKSQQKGVLLAQWRRQRKKGEAPQSKMSPLKAVFKGVVVLGTAYFMSWYTFTGQFDEYSYTWGVSILQGMAGFLLTFLTLGVLQNSLEKNFFYYMSEARKERFDGIIAPLALALSLGLAILMGTGWEGGAVASIAVGALSTAAFAFPILGGEGEISPGRTWFAGFCLVSAMALALVGATQLRILGGMG